jgi:phage repressor protein C with HTH and peptisase S24 domain
MDGARLLELARGVIGQGGEMWIVVTGHSMQPIIRPGDRVLLGPVDEIRPGLVVLADNGGAPLLHRVTRVLGEEVVLRGDATHDDDRPLRVSDVVGRVRMVSRGPVLQGLPQTFGVVLKEGAL